MGPLHGVKVIELTGIGPGPFAGTLLSDMGAEVVRVERAELGDVARAGRAGSSSTGAVGARITVDLKHPDGVETVLRLVEQADALIEGFRPGVTERLGLGPDVCLARNPRLVYGRMTGWGQDGPLAHAAGHDINYIALAGALAHFGRVGQPPTPPINLVGDYGGGGMFLAFGVVCGILEARAFGPGSGGRRGDGRRRRVPDGRDLGPARDRWLSARSAAPTCSTPARPSTTCTRPPTASGCRSARSSRSSTRELLELTGLEHDDLPAPDGPQRLAAAARAAHRDLQGEDARRVGRAARGHRRVLRAGAPDERGDGRTRTSWPARSIVEHDGIDQPAPAPRFSRTPPEIQGPAALPGEHTDAVLADWGFGGRRGRARCSRPVRGHPSRADQAALITDLDRVEPGGELVRRRPATTVTWPSLRPGRGALP